MPPRATASFHDKKQWGKIPNAQIYFNGSPNPTKVALFLEEAGIAYQPVAVDTRKGDQFKPEYLAINPNAKVPAIDDDGVKVFDGNAILLYLAEKTGKFLPANTPANRGELLSWLMFAATGVGPSSGQAVHFKHFAPEKIDYAITATSSRRSGISASRRPPRQPPLYGRRRLYHRRHRRLGLGPHASLRARRGRGREVS